MAGLDLRQNSADPTWDYFGLFENYKDWQKSIVDKFGGGQDTFQQNAVRFFAENVIPFVHLLNAVFFTVGFIFILIAFNRLKQHGQGAGGGRHTSPLSTIFYFLSGTMLMNYAPIMTAISNSLFDYSANDLKDYAGSLQNSNGLLYYVAEMQNAGLNQHLIMQQITFGLLMVVGIISFARGLMLLVKVGESGGGPEAGIGKAITHILAGLVGVNGLAFYKLMNSIVPLS